MSKIALTPNASGTGTLTIAAPNTNSDRTLTLPDATGTLATTADIPSVNPFTLGTAVASTSGTAIDFTGIPSWAKRVTVMFIDVSFAADPDALCIRLGTSSGIDTTANYKFVTNANVYDTAASLFILSDFYATTAGSTVYSGKIIFEKTTGNTWVMVGATATTAPVGISTPAGSKALTGPLDRVRIFPSNATTFDAGTINISYEG